MVTGSKQQLPISTAISNTSKTTRSDLKDPRIVRVSRLFGGKDRHSKVTTIRGLRDRRVRLSVPTAIQLYDLQDRLGLNQPSKVVDWLLNAAQPEIDKLPPLEFPDAKFLQFHQCSEASSKASSIHHDQNLNHEREHQLEGLVQGSGSSDTALYQDIGIRNTQISFHQNHLHPNSRAGSQSSGFLNNCDSENRNYLSQYGILSSQVELGPASVLSSNYYMTAAPCDLDGRQLSHLQMGSSPQQNLSLNNNAIFRSSFRSGSPKTRPL